MKKIRFLAIIMALCMLVSMVACSNGDTGDTDAGTTEDTTNDTTGTTAPDNDNNGSGNNNNNGNNDNGNNDGNGSGDGGNSSFTPKYSWATEGGDGTEASPLIINQNNFTAFYEFYLDGGWNGFMPNANEHFKLTSDIVVNEGNAADWATTPPAKTYSRPMGAFSGTLDGNGHSISGFYLKTTEPGVRAAMFHQISSDGVVKNLSIKNSYIELGYTVPGEHYAAATIAGRVVGGKIENCYSDAIITCSVERPAGTTASFSNTAMGGFAGMSQSVGSTFTGCVFAGSIKFENSEGRHGKVAGIVAYGNSGDLTITNCLNLGSLTGRWVGGIAGGLDIPTTITNSFNLSTDINVDANGTCADIIQTAAGMPTVNSSVITGYTVGIGILGANANAASVSINTITMDQFLTANLEGWYYADNYLPTPIEGLQIAVPQAS